MHHRCLAITPLLALALILAACGGSGPTPSPASSPDGSSAPPTATPASPTPAPSSPPSPASSPGASGAASPVPSGLQAELEALAEEIVDQVAELRGLAELKPVKTEAFDEAALTDHVLSSFAEESTAEELAADEGLLRRLGLLDPGASLGDLYTDLLTSQVLGLYDTDDETLRVVARGDTVGGLEKITMSHELTHALQDQHFDLDELLPPDLEDESDLVLARQAVAEGDATLLMTQWAIGHLAPAELAEMLAAANDPEQQAILARTPAILTETLEFPYLQGQALATTAWSDGGWTAVDALYARPPDSTEQVLHPEKYEADEAPLDVELPADLAGRMGAGWQVAAQDTHGEFVTGLWLREAGVGTDDATAEDAVAGWGGDRLAYLVGPDGADAVAWRTAWDTAADADEFQAAAGRTVGEGIGDDPAAGTVIRATPDEVWVLLASDGAVLDAATRAVGFASAG